MTDRLAGMACLVLAGMMNASFTLPMKFMRRWSWENTWFAWTILALLLLPALVTVGTVPQLNRIYAASPRPIVLDVLICGAGWGVAQVLFGLAVDGIGIALTFSLVMGISAVMGTLEPLARLNPGRLNAAAGHQIAAGEGLLLSGVLLCAVAGRMREMLQKRRTNTSTGTALGLILAVLCGFGAAFVNIGFSIGAPLMQVARNVGVGPVRASAVVWMPLLFAGAVPNLLYCLWLLQRNKSGEKFRRENLGYWGLALVMATCWFGSTFLYGAATTMIGSWGPILGWPVFMSLIVIAATLLGVAMGEWENSGKLPIRIQWGGVAMLVLAVFVLANTSRPLR